MLVILIITNEDLLIMEPTIADIFIMGGPNNRLVDRSKKRPVVNKILYPMKVNNVSVLDCRMVT